MRIKIDYGKSLALVIFLIAFGLSITARHYAVFATLEDHFFLGMRQMLRQHIAPLQQELLDPRIAMVTIDEDFFAVYKAFPLKRSDIAKIITNIDQLGARVIVVDMLFDYPDSYGDDVHLASALRASGKVVLASQAQFSEGVYSGIKRPVESLTQNVTSGYTNIRSSNTVGSIHCLDINRAIYQQHAEWPIAVAAVSEYLGLQPAITNNVLYFGEQHQVALDNQCMLIDFPLLPAGTHFLHEMYAISAADFLSLEQISDSKRNELSAWVKDKIVLLGDTSEVSNDIHVTPLARAYGLEVIASAINTLLKNGPLSMAPDHYDYAAILLLFLAVFAVSFLGNPVIEFLLYSSVFIIHFIFAMVMFVNKGMVFSLAYPYVVGISAIAILYLYRSIDEKNKKDKVAHLFGHYLSPKVVELLCSDITALKPGGNKKYMTAFFTDIEGFSTFSENIPPEKLVLIMNEYFTGLCNIIDARGGTVDKFIGDAVMAFWGAPVDQDDHAERACNAAIDIQQYLAGHPHMNTRIGIHVGMMIEGNMGSDSRLNYTIMGDAVNLASRLEGANKYYGSNIMISEDTLKCVAGKFVVRELDNIRVTGKANSLAIYQLYGRINEQVVPKEFLDTYAIGIAHFKQKNFVDAEIAFRAASKIIPDDIPCGTYIARCIEFQQNPPAPDWDGVFQLPGK